MQFVPEVGLFVLVPVKTFYSCSEIWMNVDFTVDPVRPIFILSMIWTVMKRKPNILNHISFYFRILAILKYSKQTLVSLVVLNQTWWSLLAVCHVAWSLFVAVHGQNKNHNEFFSQITLWGMNSRSLGFFQLFSSAFCTHEAATDMLYKHSSCGLPLISI